MAMGANSVMLVVPLIPERSPNSEGRKWPSSGPGYIVIGKGRISTVVVPLMPESSSESAGMVFGFVVHVN